MALMILSSIAECRKALEYLKEKGTTSGTLVELQGVPCPVRTQEPNGELCVGGHQLVLLDDKTLKCQFCGKVFHSKHQALTREDCIRFGSLDPKVPFEQELGQKISHS